MYYTGRILSVKNIVRERIYLYNRGDECIDITGGWTSTTANIFKTPTYIQFNQAADNGLRRISTVNNIEFTVNDRLFVVLECTSNTTYAYRMLVYMTTSQTNSTRFRNLITGNNGITQTHFTPNVEKTVMFYHTLGWNDLISLVNNYGFWKVHEIYIEKYE